MATLRFSVLIGLAVLYFGTGHLLSRRAMRHFRGPGPPPGLETPLLAPELFDAEGQRRIRQLRWFCLVGGLACALIIAAMNRL